MVEVGVNGHVYIPKMLKEKYPDEFFDKKRTTFGRGYKARQKAEQMVVDYVYDLLNENVWAAPDSIGTPNTLMPGQLGGNNSLSVKYWNDVWGYVRIGVLMYTPSWGNRSRLTLSASIQCHPMVRAWTEMAVTLTRLTQNINQAGSEEFNIMNVQNDDIEARHYERISDTMRDFAQDPWRTVKSTMPDATFYEENLAPRHGWETLRDLEYRHNYQSHAIDKEMIPDQYGGLKERVLLATNVGGSAHLYSENRLKSVIVENMGALEEMFEAFSLMNIKFRIDSAYGGEGTQYSGKQIVRGFTLELPANPRLEGQAHPHEISVDAKGITVNCGYLADEAKFIDYQKRHVKDVLSDMDDMFGGDAPVTEEWSETTYKLGGK